MRHLVMPIFTIWMGQNVRSPQVFLKVQIGLNGMTWTFLLSMDGTPMRQQELVRLGLSRVWKTVAKVHNLAMNFHLQSWQGRGGLLTWSWKRAQALIRTFSSTC